MAKKIKATQKNIKSETALKQDKEESIEVKQLLTDERTHKIAGSILILLGLLFFIALPPICLPGMKTRIKYFMKAINYYWPVIPRWQT